MRQQSQCEFCQKVLIIDPLKINDAAWFRFEKKKNIEKEDKPMQDILSNNNLYFKPFKINSYCISCMSIIWSKVWRLQKYVLPMDNCIKVIKKYRVENQYRTVYFTAARSSVSCNWDILKLSPNTCSSISGAVVRHIQDIQDPAI